jgi:hypothetical protein
MQTASAESDDWLIIVVVMGLRFLDRVVLGPTVLIRASLARHGTSPMVREPAAPQDG